MKIERLGVGNIRIITMMGKGRSSLSEYILEVENLKQHFPIEGSFGRNKGTVKAVDGVSFAIKKGTTLGIVGESGCGKSTTARTILNLIKATEGKITFDGKVLFNSKDNYSIPKNEMLSLRKDMQIIFQDPYACLDPRMNVEKIVSEGIRKHEKLGKKEARERVEDLLELCGIGKEQLNKFPHQFSGGQRQRIGIARALSLNPKFLICDEPTAALDVSIQSQILNLMMKLKKEMSLTYLFISHDLSVVRNFCDEVCVMYLGKIVEKGPSKDIYERTLHPYSKALISSAPSFDPLKRVNRQILIGDIPSPMNPPKGCRFSTRCPMAKEICSSKEPELKEYSKNHFAACHIIDGGTD
jgi:oligopeptide/dipeptide ABC transporter ATP-binding protein